MIILFPISNFFQLVKKAAKYKRSGAAGGEEVLEDLELSEKMCLAFHGQAYCGGKFICCCSRFNQNFSVVYHMQCNAGNIRNIYFRNMASKHLFLDYVYWCPCYFY